MMNKPEIYLSLIIIIIVMIPRYLKKLCSLFLGPYRGDFTFRADRMKPLAEAICLNFDDYPEDSCTSITNIALTFLDWYVKETEAGNWYFELLKEGVG